MKLFDSRVDSGVCESRGEVGDDGQHSIDAQQTHSAYTHQYTCKKSIKLEKKTFKSSKNAGKSKNAFKMEKKYTVKSNCAIYAMTENLFIYFSVNFDLLINLFHVSRFIQSSRSTLSPFQIKVPNLIL